MAAPKGACQRPAPEERGEKVGVREGEESNSARCLFFCDRQLQLHKQTMKQTSNEVFWLHGREPRFRPNL